MKGVPRNRTTSAQQASSASSGIAGPSPRRSPRRHNSSSSHVRMTEKEELIAVMADLEAEQNAQLELINKIKSLQSNLSDVTRISEEQATTLHETDQALQKVIEENNVLNCQLSDLQAKAQEVEKVHTEEVAQLNATRNDTQVAMESKIAGLEEEVATMNSIFAALVLTRPDIVPELESEELESDKEYLDVVKLYENNVEKCE